MKLNHKKRGQVPLPGRPEGCFAQRYLTPFFPYTQHGKIGHTSLKRKRRAVLCLRFRACVPFLTACSINQFTFQAFSNSIALSLTWMSVAVRRPNNCSVMRAPLA